MSCNLPWFIWDEIMSFVLTPEFNHFSLLNKFWFQYYVTKYREIKLDLSYNTRPKSYEDRFIQNIQFIYMKELDWEDLSSRFPSLKHVKFQSYFEHRYDNSPKNIAQKITHFPLLERISLDLIFEEFYNIGCSIFIKHFCKSLKELNLNGEQYRPLYYMGLYKNFKFPKLHTFIIHCPLSYFDIKEVVLSFPKVKKIVCESCLTHKVSAKLDYPLNNLKELGLTPGSCWSGEGEYIEINLSSFPGLTKLELVGNTNLVTDSQGGKVPRISEVILHSPTPLLLNYVSTNFVLLKSLTIETRYLNQDILRVALSKFNQISSLAIMNTSEINIEVFLDNKLVNIKRLFIENTGILSSGLLVQINASFPNLTHLTLNSIQPGTSLCYVSTEFKELFYLKTISFGFKRSQFKGFHSIIKLPKLAFRRETYFKAPKNTMSFF